MRAAERRQKIVKRCLVRQIDGGQLQAPFVFVAVKEIVMAERKIEQVPRRDALRVVVVIFREWRRYFEVSRSELCRRALIDAVYERSDRSGRSWMLRSTEEPGLELLISCQRCSRNRVEQTHIAVLDVRV